MPRSGAITLSRPHRPDTLARLQDMRAQGRYSVERLQAKHGDARLTDLRGFLTADCPKHGNGPGTGSRQ